MATLGGPAHSVIFSHTDFVSLYFANALTALRWLLLGFPWELAASFDGGRFGQLY